MLIRVVCGYPQQVISLLVKCWYCWSMTKWLSVWVHCSMCMPFLVRIDFHIQIVSNEGGGILEVTMVFPYPTFWAHDPQWPFNMLNTCPSQSKIYGIAFRGRGSVPRSDFLGQEVHLIICWWSGGYGIIPKWLQFYWNDKSDMSDRCGIPILKFSRISDFRGQTSYSKGYGKGTKDAKVLHGDVTFGSFWTQKNPKSNIW
jgi:hypothetical protein